MVDCRYNETASIISAFYGAAFRSARHLPSIPTDSARSSPVCADSGGADKTLIFPVESPIPVSGRSSGAKKMDHTGLYSADERCGEGMARIRERDQRWEETQFCAASGTERITA